MNKTLLLVGILIPTLMLVVPHVSFASKESNTKRYNDGYQNGGQWP